MSFEDKGTKNHIYMSKKVTNKKEKNKNKVYV